jgi:pimeloyl-ACP methyl ester carboxylesterase
MNLSIDGRTAYAYTGGKAFDPSLPCIVFLHGAMHDHSVWTLLARWYAHHGHGVLAFDLPGHGRSAGAPLANVEALADWTLAAVTVAGVATETPIELVGHSMGSLIALEAAARAGERRVRRLALLATAYPMTVSPALLATADEAPQEAIEMVNAYSHSTQAAKPSHPGPGTWLHGSNRALMRRVLAQQTGTNLFAHDFALCNAYMNGLEAAARVRCPVDVILGTRDQMTQPKQSRELVGALRARVQTLDAGHALMTEAPDTLLAALRGRATVSA